VIGGSFARTRLEIPPGVRPTTGRVREALFSSLGTRVHRAAVLDLYSGSGALAVEAMSLGAARAVLVDRDRAAVEAGRANLRWFEQSPSAPRWRVEQSTVARFLDRGPPPEAPFDLVFLDPPYEMRKEEVEGVLARLVEPGWLAPGATVVVERPARGEPLATSHFEPTWERRYGDTLVTVLALAG